ncbi:hypothetical protein BJ742DRAFT_85456 [Cladochytrium replicatum]|nr:hypothetical protein BJ742DRAFT_85456 [Cladochytrium replicatum]
MYTTGAARCPAIPGRLPRWRPVLQRWPTIPLRIRRWSAVPIQVQLRLVGNISPWMSPWPKRIVALNGVFVAKLSSFCTIFFALFLSQIHQRVDIFEGKWWSVSTILLPKFALPHIFFFFAV